MPKESKSKITFTKECNDLAKKVVQESASISSKRWGDLMKDVSHVELGRRLSKLRTKYNVRPAAIAERMGIRNPTICNLEKGRFRWNQDKVLRYIEAIVALSS